MIWSNSVGMEMDTGDDLGISGFGFPVLFL